MKRLNVYLALANLVLWAVVLVLLILDAIWPLWNIFLNEFVKALLLVTCVLSAVNGARLYARWRRRLRYNRRYRR